MRVALAAAGMLVAVSAPPLFAHPAEQGRKPAARAPLAMVSSSHPVVTEAMLEVLRGGGNAVDAMIAGVILQPVIEPQMSTLAGGIGALIYDARSGRFHYLDAELDHTSVDAPIGHSMGDRTGVSETSGRRIGVPGTVAGLRAAAERFGTKKWADYFPPAIRLAEEGYPMYSFLYAEMAEAALGRLASHPSGREEFMPEGFVPPVGTLVKRPRLAATLRRLASEGPDFFYKGEWARRFVDVVKSTGGTVSLEDLAGYEARWSEPVRSTYRGHEIWSSPPPATGGSLIALTLNILESADLPSLGHYTESPRVLALFRQAVALAEDDTNTWIRDPLAFEVPLQALLSKDYARWRARLVTEGWPRGRTAGPAHASLRREDRNSTDTNHLVVVDAMGNWVSATHTVYGSTFATGLFVDGIGANSGNTFPGNGTGRGRRVLAPFPPTMVAKEGKPWLAAGSPGLSSRAVTIFLANRLGYGRDLEASVDAPRFQGFQPADAFLVETRIPDSVRAALKDYGMKVEPTAPYNWHFGSVQAIERAPSGELVGVADPRRGGHAAGY